MHKPYLRSKRTNNQPIKQTNQSKQIDAVQKQPTDYYDKQLRSQFYEKNNENDKFSSIKQSLTNNHQVITKLQYPKKYYTNENTNTKTVSKLYQYNSGQFHSTQAASPYHKFQSQKNYNQQHESDYLVRKSDYQQNSVKKKLFYEQQIQQNSPQFQYRQSLYSSKQPSYDSKQYEQKMKDLQKVQKLNLRQSKFDKLSYTFKKKVDNYPRLFSERTAADEQIDTDRRIRFYMINFSTARSKQNDSNRINLNNIQSRNEQDSILNIKKKLNFEQVNFQQREKYLQQQMPIQNPLLKRINQQIRRNALQIEQKEKDNIDRDYRKSRKTQQELIKRKVLESKSDLKRFYQLNSKNVQYQYRKAKFMDIFLGTKTLQHNIR